MDSTNCVYWLTMTDFLFVPDAGHGAWSWGRVWGHLTAPVGNPPRLHVRGRVGKVISLDLLGQGSQARNGGPGAYPEDFVSAITDEVGSQGLQDLILVGHGISAPLLLHAASRLEVAPRRIVLFAGAIPYDGKCALDMLPPLNKLAFKIMSRRLNGRPKGQIKLPRTVIDNLYCNGMDPGDVTQIVGRFAPFPPQMLKTKLYLSTLPTNCPITYVPLWRDRLFPPGLQRRMASRFPGVEVAGELDSSHEVLIERPRRVAEILLNYS